MPQMKSVTELDLPPPRWAYVTMVTSDDFMQGAQVLLHSLAKHSRLPNERCEFVVLCTDQVSKPVRRQIARAASGKGRPAATMRVVEAIPNPHAATVHVKGWVNAGFTKLHVWGLVEYERVVYIDADALVLDSVDELFERPLGDAPGAFAAAPDVFPPDRFNAGVLALRPDAAVFAELCAAAVETPSYDGGDTGFLNAHYPGWFAMPAANRLPFGYNAQRTLHWMTFAKQPGYWNAVKDKKILHFSSSPKPWQDAKRKGELEALWWAAYLEFSAPPGVAGLLAAMMGGGA